jgi:hypothetical protein
LKSETCSTNFGESTKRKSARGRKKGAKNKTYRVVRFEDSRVLFSGCSRGLALALVDEHSYMEEDVE